MTPPTGPGFPQALRLRDGRAVEVRRVRARDAAGLVAYFSGLGPATRGRFGPHPFDAATVGALCARLDDDVRRYLAVDAAAGGIVAYHLVKHGWVEEDRLRYARAGREFAGETLGTYAPSVADAWQDSGLGSALYGVIEADLRRATAIRRLVLWGGVQAGNALAVHFYAKHGFLHAGEFVHNGMDNFDMVKELAPGANGR